MAAETNWNAFTHITFDCYGTLVDWETGILEAVRAGLKPTAPPDDGTVLGAYARLEAKFEAGPYRSYREILSLVWTAMALEFGVRVAEIDRGRIADSVGRWPVFPDTVPALQRLKSKYKLAVISNIDDAMFAQTARRLEVPFDDVITAEQVGSYKPSTRNFEVALKRLAVGRERVLHVAQSLYHDHVPARSLGITTVWVNRPSRRPGVGVAPPASAEPALEVASLGELADSIGV